MSPRSIDRGSLYIVSNDLINWAPNPVAVADQPKPTDTHPVVVVSADDLNWDPEWKIVLVCPISRAPHRHTSIDVRLMPGKDQVKYPCSVRVELVQPLFKVHLQVSSATFRQTI